jgi:hypothetical protein
MSPRPLPTRTQAIVSCVLCAVAALTCAGLFTAAALAHAPTVVIPEVALVCVGAPIMFALDVLASLAVLRATRPGGLDRRALAELRRRLDRLPETRHPLGF